MYKLLYIKILTKRIIPRLIYFCSNDLELVSFGIIDFVSLWYKLNVQSASGCRMHLSVTSKCIGFDIRIDIYKPTSFQQYDNFNKKAYFQNKRINARSERFYTLSFTTSRNESWSTRTEKFPKIVLFVNSEIHWNQWNNVFICFKEGSLFTYVPRQNTHI